jgi:hypothetical protein
VVWVEIREGKKGGATNVSMDSFAKQYLARQSMCAGQGKQLCPISQAMALN